MICRRFDRQSQYGNMSSATLFFVLREQLRLRALRKRADAPRHILLVAFGPGMTIEVR